MNAKGINRFAWTLSAVASFLAILAWGQLYNWQLSALTTYQYFPLFGLLAFSLMWGHYIVSAVRQYAEVGNDAVAGYFKITSWAVLFSILMHPSLLILQLFLDGVGLPPFSYYRYVGAAGKWAVTVATISFVAFLSYELYRWFSGRGWWKYVQYASDLAMFGIIYHSLTLGSHVQGGWFRSLWWFYAVSYTLALLYGYTKKPA